MRSRQLVHVKNFAVGGRFSVELWTVPRRYTGFGIMVVDGWIIVDTVDLVRITDFVSTYRRLRRRLNLLHALCGVYRVLGFSAGCEDSTHGKHDKA